MVLYPRGKGSEYVLPSFWIKGGRKRSVKKHMTMANDKWIGLADCYINIGIYFLYNSNNNKEAFSHHVESRKLIQ
ncbi:hypothetical protein CR513_62027, partial [Mucuna pruriens]